MQSSACRKLLLFVVLCKLGTKSTMGHNWPVILSDFNLIGIFPWQADEESKTDMWTIHCRAMFKAAILLSKKYNMTFQGQYLTYEEIITNGSIIRTVGDDICQKVSTSNVVGFVGPAFSNEARYVASFVHGLGILSVSYSATSPELSAIDNGAFYRVVSSDENMVVSITALFRRYSWKSCIIIYDNDEYGYDGMKMLSQKLWEINIRTHETIKFDRSQQNFQIDLNSTLLNSMSRIVIVWANKKSTVTIVNKALKESLMGSSFVWILTTTIPLDHFSQTDKEKLIGILTVEPVKGDLVGVPIDRELLNEAYELWNDYEHDTFPGNDNVSSYALYTFDAAWSIILSLQELCSIQPSCLEFINGSNCYQRRFAQWKQYYDIMKTKTFLGVSGTVKFLNGTGDRLDAAYYLIKNIQKSNTILNGIGYVPVLQWDPDRMNWTSYKNQSDDITWPNSLKTIPTDYKPMRGNEI